MDLLRRRLARLLREPLERKQDMRAAAFGREKDAEDLPVALGSNLVDVAAQVTCRREPELPYLLHGGDDCCGVCVRELIEEVLDGSSAGGRPVVAPASLDL